MLGTVERHLKRLGSSRVFRRRWTLVKPSLINQRGDCRLLIWGDIPHWTVVDAELFHVLNSLDGIDNLDAIIDRRGLQTHRSDLGSIVQQLARHGVLKAEGVHAENSKREDDSIENIALNLTSRCNLRCGFCYNLPNLKNKPKNELSVTEVSDFIHDLRPFLAAHPSLTILGGEPFLYPEKLLEISERVADLNMTVIVSTNGTRMTHSLARALKQKKIQVQVSLDSSRPTAHNTIRGNGTFEEATHTLKLLVDAGVHTTISMVCHQDNIHELENYFDFGHTLGVTQVRFIPLRKIGGDGSVTLRPVPVADLIRRAAKLFKERPALHALAATDALSILAGTCALSSKRASCGTGRKTLLLDADGSLYPCLNTQVPELKAGTIRDPEFNAGHFWKTNAVFNRVRQETDVDSDASLCRDCPLRYWCLAGCRGENAAATGSLRSKALDCEGQTQAILETLWLLAEQPQLAKSVQPYC